jgi:hypothetical protein
VNLSPTGWPTPLDDRQPEQRWSRGGKRLELPGWPTGSRTRWRQTWDAEHTLDGGMFYHPSVSELTIGRPGEAGFGVARDWAAGVDYLRVIHVGSRSVVNDVPVTIRLASVSDPFADPTAAGFTFNGDPFPVGSAYTIGSAGAEHFAIATVVATSTAIIDPIHTASLSVM